MKSTKKTSIVSWIIYILLYIPLFFSLFYGYVINAKDTSSNNVHTVHIVFSHHLDVGLDLPFKITGDCVGFATKIVQRYFDEYIPRAISLAEKIRNNNNTQISFKYQIHSWIASLYVDCVHWTVSDNCFLDGDKTRIRCPSVSAVKIFDEAVLKGDIVWTAAPFNINAEAVGEATLFHDLTSISNRLNKRYGKNNSKVWANVDVKGFSRSAIPLLRKANVTALYIGANGAAKVASKPPSRGLQPVVGDANATMFKWIDPHTNSFIPVLWFDGYGGYETRSSSIISSNGVALAAYFRSDNSGPPLLEAEVENIFNKVHGNFPNAKVLKASSFDAFVNEALTEKVVENLKNTSLDWGDQWLTGLSTDPYRLAVFRLMTRERKKCIDKGLCNTNFDDDFRIFNFTRFLAKNVEHTQGVQGEQWSPGIAGIFQKELADRRHWSNQEFEKVHNEKFNIFGMGDLSWLESRKFNDLALEALEDHPLASIIKDKLNKFKAGIPNVSKLTKQDNLLNNPIDCGTTDDGIIHVQFDSKTGAIVNLTLGGEHWLYTKSSLLSNTMFNLAYATYNKMEFWDTRKNLTCPETGCANPEDKVWQPKLVSIWHNSTTTKIRNLQNDIDNNRNSLLQCKIITKLTFDTKLHERYGAPQDIYVEYDLFPNKNRIEVSFNIFGKRTTRLPESLYVSFEPNRFNNTKNHWELDILGSWVGVDEVGRGTTNALQRGVWRGARYLQKPTDKFESASLVVESLDAGMCMPIVPGLGNLGNVSPMGENHPIPVPSPLTNVNGVAFSLMQNLMPISGFNQWYPFGVGKHYQKQDENSLFRFAVQVEYE